MRRVLFVVILILVLVSAGACSPGDNKSDQSSPPADRVQDTQQPSPTAAEGGDAESNPIELPPIEQVDEVAALFYQGLSEGRNMAGFIAEIYHALEIPVLNPETEFDQIESALETQSPFILDSHLELLANAFASGMYIDLESFIAEINHQGFYLLETGGEVTLDDLSGNLAYLVDQGELAPDEIPIALVMALGRTRANNLYGDLQDPVWGDDLLDPLQSSLLWHLLDQVAADAQANIQPTIQRSFHLSALANPQRRGPMAEILGSLAETAEFANNLCNNARIFGHQSTLTLSEYQVYRINGDPNKPFLSQAIFSVEFKYKPSSAAHKLTIQLGCPDLPSVGPRQDISVEWEIKPNGEKKPTLLDLGAFTPGEATNYQGLSEANYLANPEVVPSNLQDDMNAHFSDGQIRATAKLYPDNEIIATIIATYPDRGDIESKYLGEAFLSVGYYTFPTIRWNRDNGFIKMDGIAWSCDGVNWIASHVFSQTLPGQSTFTSAEFSFTMPEFPLDNEIKSNPIEVVFTGTWETPDGPVPVEDTREVWLSITDREITMNFEPLGATATIEGQTINVGAGFVFRSIPTEKVINTHCDGE